MMLVAILICQKSKKPLIPRIDFKTNKVLLPLGIYTESINERPTLNEKTNQIRTTLQVYKVDQTAMQITFPREIKSSPIPPKTRNQSNTQKTINDLGVGGRLQRFLPAWRLSKAPTWIIDIIKRGYHWAWMSSPPPLEIPHLQSQNTIISSLVEEMIRKGAIYQVPPQPSIVSRIFAAPKSDGTHRLVIDLTKLNNFIASPSFAITNQHSLKKIVDLPCWMASLDIKDAFLHVPVRPNLQKYLGLTCNNKLYFFKTLPFGLTTSPRIFTFLMRHPLALLHAAGVHAIVYLDDLCIWRDSPSQVQNSLAKSSALLTELGFFALLAKIPPSPLYDTHMAGSNMGHQDGHMERSSVLLRRNQTDSNSTASEKEKFSTSLRSPHRENSLCCPVFPTSPLALPRAGQAPINCPKTSRLTSPKNSLQSISISSKMGRGRFLSSTLTNSPALSFPYDLDRCFINRLGIIHINRPLLHGQMVPCTEKSPHQPARNSGRSVDNEAHSTGDICLNNVGQQDYSFSHQSNRLQESVNPDVCNRLISTDMVNETTSDSFAHPRLRQRSSRPVVKRRSHRVGVGTVSQELQVLEQSNRRTRSRLVCQPNESQAPTLCCSLCTPKSNGNKCLCSRLEPAHEFISVPTSKRNSPRHIQTPSLQRARSDYCSQTSNSYLVPVSTEEMPDTDITSPSPTNSRRHSLRTLTNAVRSLDRLSFLKLVYHHRYPENVVDALISGYRDSSNRQFETGWRAFQSWLSEDEPIITKAVFLSFLVFIRDSGFSHNTALSYRNALKIPFDVAFNINTGEKEFDLLSKSHFLHNPPRPKIIPSWSLDNAIESLQGKGDLSSLSSEETFMACLFLIAVATGNRCSELAHIDRSSILFAPDGSDLSMSPLLGFLLSYTRIKGPIPTLQESVLRQFSQVPLYVLSLR